MRLESDARLRGLSLTDRRPALSLSSGVDLASGLYAGGTVMVDNPSRGGPTLLGHTEQAGFAARTGSGLAWDVGVSNTNVKIQTTTRRTLRYSEVYFGLARDGYSARIAYSPNYQGRVSTVYLTLGATLQPAETWRLSAHAGVLKRLGGPDARLRLRERYDVRLAVTRELGDAELGLAWTAAYGTPGPSAGKNGVVASATLHF